jgi:signal transduction histidine kinase
VSRLSPSRWLTLMALWRRLVAQRVRERAFWIIQAMVLAITATHMVVEGLDWFTGGPWLAVGMQHFPVVLYLVPVVYAGLRYGFEGAGLTGVWSVALSLPNVILWHSESYLWAAELVYVAGVVTVGLVVAVPVERDRRQQRRLAFLNDVASMLVASPLDRVLLELLARVRDELALDGVAVDSPELGELTAAVPREREAARRRLAAAGAFAGLPPGCTSVSDGLMAVPLGDDPGTGTLVVWTAQDSLERSDCDLLASVANQIGLALANRRLGRQAEAQLRQYVHGVTRAQEEERKRIALELHDTAAQDLVRLCRGLDGLDRPDGERVGGRQDLRQLAEGTLDGLRRLSRDLRPTLLDDLGLAPALEWLAADLAERGMEVRCEVLGDVRRLHPDTELALFRIVQEALRNVEKHADASHVDIAVRFEPGRVAVAVIDDGRGITEIGPTEQLVRAGKLGLAGMHERAALIGARLSVDSCPEGGTAVDVHAPVEADVRGDQAGRSAKNLSAGTNISA